MRTRRIARPTVMRRVAVLVAVAVVLATATVLAVTGTREPAAALKLLTGRAWLANSHVGTVSQVDGYSGKVGAQTGVGQAGDPFEVVQRPDGAYILDLRTGKLTRVSDATLAAAASRQLPGSGPAQQVLTGPAGTWVLDRASGVLQQVDPDSLAPMGPAIPLGASTGVAVLDADGTPWVPIPSQGTVVEVTPSGLQRHPVGQPGDDVVLEVTSSGVWAVDGQAGQARSLVGPGQLQIPQAPAGTAPVAGSSPTSPYLAVVAGDQLLDIDTSRPSQSATTSPSYAGTSQIALVDNEAYLLPAAGGRLETANLAPLAPGAPITVPPGADQLVSKDGVLFVNNANSPQAVVVNPGGQVTPVSKYTQAAATPSPASAPAATAVPTPLNLLPGPGGGAASTGLPGPAGGNGTGGPSGLPTNPGLPTPAPAPAAPAPAPQAAPAPSPQAPGAPTLAPVSASGPTLSASWSPPANPGTSAITSYKLIVTPQGAGTTPAPVTVGGQSTSGQVGGLSGNGTYCAQVQAVNGAGAGPLSNQQCAKTSNDVPGAPGQPSVTLGSVSGSSQAATATWSAPTTLGPFNTPIAGYEVTAAPDSGASTTMQTSSTSTPLSLAVGHTYTVTVKAVNANGNASPSSAGTSVTTDGPPSSVSRVTVKADDGELDASWTAASANHGQAVTYTVSDGATSVDVSGTSHAFTGLTPGHTYTIKVTPKSAAGSTAGTSATGTPWGPRDTLYECQSANLWGNYPFDLTNSNCGNQPGYSISTLTGSVPNTWVYANRPKPPNAEVLYSGVVGTTAPAGNFQDSQYYNLVGPNDHPSGWSYSAGGQASTLVWVFSSAADAGPGSTQMCEVYHPDSAHPWFNIYPTNAIPAGTNGCMAGTTFWT